jgi:hypothetical protein
LRFSRNLTALELHDADRVGRLPVVQDYIFGNPQVTGSDHAPDFETFPTWQADVASIRMRFCILTSLRSTRPIQLLTSDIDPLAFVTGMTSNAPSKVLGDEFQDDAALSHAIFR